LEASGNLHGNPNQWQKQKLSVTNRTRNPNIAASWFASIYLASETAQQRCY
jgi:hypothetical protein